MIICFDEILWRNKCAFSDGVSNQKKFLHTIIKSFFDKELAMMNLKAPLINISIVLQTQRKLLLQKDF